MELLFKQTSIQIFLLISLVIVIESNGVRYLSRQCDGYYTDGSLDRPCGMCRICRRIWRTDNSTIDRVCKTLKYFWEPETQFPFSAVSTDSGTYCTTRDTCSKCRCDNARKDKQDKPVCVNMLDACKCGCGERRYGQECEFEIPAGLTKEVFADVKNIIYTPFVYSSEFANIVMYFYSTGLNLKVEIRTERELLVYDIEGCKREIIGVSELCHNWFGLAGVGNYLKECEGGATYDIHGDDEMCAIEINYAFPRARAHPWNEKQFVWDFDQNPEIKNKPIIGKDEKLQVRIYNNISELQDRSTIFNNDLGLVVFYVGKTKFEQCPPVLTIHRYGKDMFILSIFPRKEELSLSCAIKLNDSPDCKEKGGVHVVINWYMWIIKYNHDEKRDLPLLQKFQTTSLVLPSYSLDFGVYKVKAEVKVISDNQLNYETTYSYFKIIQLPFHPIIVGGSVRYVYFKDHLELISQEILDYDYPLHNQPAMSYVWTCNDTDRVCTERTTKDLNLTVNGPFIAGKVYNFTMKVTSHSKSYLIISDQIVIMYQNPIPALLIICLKNCGCEHFETDTQEQLHFKVIHSKYSSPLRGSDTYEWTCTKSDNSVIALKTIQQEEKTPSWILIVDENKLENDVMYIFKVVGPNEVKGQSTFAIKTFRSFDYFGCDINPKQGIAGETKFYVNCSVTNKEENINSYMYTFYDMSNETDLPGRLVGSSYVGFIGDIVLTRGIVAIYATNTFGQFHKTYVSAKLTPPNIDVNFVEDKIKALQAISQGQGHEQKISFISSLCDILNSNTSMKASAVEILLEIISQEKATDISQLELLLSVTQSVICIENNCEINITTKSFNYLSEIFLETAHKFQTELVKASQLTTELTSLKVDILYTQLLQCAEVLLTAQHDGVVNKSYENVDYEAYELFKYSNLKIIGSLHHIQTGLALRTLPFVKHHAINTQYVETWMKEDYPQYFIEGTKGGSYISMTPALANYLSEKADYLVVNTIEFKKNPYWWSQDSDIATNAISVNIGYKYNQRYIPINNFTQPIDIFLKKTTEYNIIKISGQVMQPDHNSDEIDKSVSIHKVFAIKGSTIILKFVNIKYSLRVRVMVNKRPDYHDVITGEKVTEESPNYYFSSIKEEEDVSYIGILPGEDVEEGVRLHYSFEMQTPRCQVWHNVMWKTTGCVLGLESTEELLHCQCHHLSSVAGFFGVPVNVVDPFTDVILFLTIPENPFVFALVIFILLLYILLLVWSHRSDKHNRLRLGVIILEDNISTDCFGYLIIVFTGSRLFAGTTSNIGIVLHGTDHSCPPHILKCSKRSTLTQGSDDWFILFAPEYLGTVIGIQIWTDQSGRNPNWFCERIHIHDLKSKEEYTFVLAAWFGIHQYGVCLENFQTPNELHNFDIVSMNAASGFKENHLWISMITHHPRSPKMRTHRVSLVMVAVIMMLLTNILFYDAEFPEYVDVPEYELNKRELIISIISIALAAGITFTIHVAFLASYSIREQKDVNRKKQSTLRSRRKRLLTGIRNLGVKRDCNYCFKKIAVPLKNNSFLPVQTKNDTDILIIHKLRLIFAWLLCISVILSASFFIVLYGLTFGKIKSLLWLTSLVLSVSGDVFVVDPFKILIISFLFGLANIQLVDVFMYDPFIYQLRKKGAIDKDLMNDEFVLENRLKHFYRPLSKNKMKTILLQQIEIKKWWQFIDIVDICSSVILAFLLIRFSLIGEYQVGMIFKNTMFKSIEVGKYYITTPTNISSYYSFLRRSVFPALYSTQWYNKRSIYSIELLPEFGWTADGTHRMMGIPRLRQIRTEQKECKVPFLLSNLSFYCNDLYSPLTEDTGDYGTQWKSLTWDNIMLNISIWNYVDPKDSSSISVYGDSGQEFHGGGYIVDLARSRRESSDKLWNLENARWLDIRTRAVFFEISTYNVNHNAFTIVNFITEHLETGSALTAKRIWIVNIKNYHFVFAIAYTLYIVLALIKQTMIMNTIGVRIYFRTFWLAYDFILIIIIVIYVVIYAVFSKITSEYIEEFQHNANISYSNNQDLVFHIFIRRYLMGLMMLMSVARLLRLLVHDKRIISDKLKYTLYFSSPQILGFTLLILLFNQILQRPIAYFMNSFYHFGNSYLIFYWKDYNYLVENLNQPKKGDIILISCYFSYFMSFFYIIILIKGHTYSSKLLGGGNLHKGDNNIRGDRSNFDQGGQPGEKKGDSITSLPLTTVIGESADPSDPPVPPPLANVVTSTPEH